MAIKNYTTTVSEGRTVGEIMGLLAAKGARSIRIDYDEKNQPSAVSFVVIVMDIPVPFQLPCDFDGVFKAMASEYKDRMSRLRWERNPSSMYQARRVAWRIIKNWIEAQMAMIEAGQATIAQVFLPYVKEQGVTAYEKFLQQMSNQKSLPEVAS